MELTIEQFIERLEEEFEELEPGELKPETKFRDLGEWSSMHALIIVAMISTEYDVTLNTEDLVNSQTIIDIFKIVSTKSDS